MTRTKPEFYVGVSNPNIISDDFKRFEELEHVFNTQLLELEDIRKSIDLEKIKLLDELLVLIKDFVDLKKALPKISDPDLHKKLSKQKKIDLLPKPSPKKIISNPVSKPEKKIVKSVDADVERRKKSFELSRLRSYRKELEDLSKIVENI